MSFANGCYVKPMLFESFARVNTGTFIFNWVRKGQTTVVSMKRLLFLVDAWMGACLLLLCLAWLHGGFCCDGR
jgi:hypothetical protein